MRREFWMVEREDGTGPCFSHIKEVAASKIEDGDDDFYHLVELKPTEIIIDRETLRSAFSKAYMMPWDDRDGLLGAITEVLFGEVE